VKTIALLSRRPGLSRGAFRDYYETKHVPLAVWCVHFTKYVRNHVIAPSAVPYDVLTEFWLVDPSVATSFAASPAGELLRKDEAHFKARDRFRAMSDESLLAGPPRDVEIGRVKKYAVILNRRPYATAADFIADAIDWGQRLGTVPTVTRVIIDIVKPFAGSTFPADAILSLWPTELFEPGILDTPPPSVESAKILTIDAYETPTHILNDAH
jgi:hypothetical protein